MITIVADMDTFNAAAAKLATAMDDRLQQGFEATVESIAARAKQTTTYTDRTGALRNSTMSDGVTGSGGNLVGVVSFAATSKSGRKYGVDLEFGTRKIRERRFVRDAIDAESGDLLEGAMKAAFRDAGFEVT